MRVDVYPQRAFGAARQPALPVQPAGGEDKTLFAPGTTLVYTPHPYKSPFKKAAVLYKAAAIAVKFRTILK
jgi:hypothetical protein